MLAEIAAATRIDLDNVRWMSIEFLVPSPWQRHVTCSDFDSLKLAIIALSCAKWVLKYRLNVVEMETGLCGWWPSAHVFYAYG